MNLTLVAVSLNDQPLSQPITTVFDARGGTIGRADHNTMALPDPQRHVSRLQAEVIAHGDAYLIRNVGAANPIVVGSRTLAYGDTARLDAEVPVRIGGYLLRASGAATDSAPPHPAEPWFGGPGTVEPLPAPGPPAAAPAARGSSDDPFAGLLPAAGATALVPGDNPFADLLNPPAPQPAPPAPAAAVSDFGPPPAGLAPGSAALPPWPAPAPRLPEDFDPFAAPAPAAPIAPAQDPFADLVPTPEDARSIDTMFGLGGGHGAEAGTAADDPLARFVAGAAAGPAAQRSPGEAGSVDPLSMFAPPAAAAPPGAEPDDLPALHGAWQAPRASAPAAAVAATPTPGPAAAPAEPRALEPDLAWQAFCEGAGIAPGPPSDDPLARMQRLGRIVRSAVDGTLQLIAVRASTKHELRAGVTVIRQRDNNPLKFSPDGKTGLEQLVQPPVRGFLDGPAAMENAMHDLVGHSIGTVAGMRAAVAGMLQRFEPAALEAKLTPGSMLESLLPMNRKARLWDLYLQHHDSIRDEAEEDFHTLFGKAFLAAYEQQIERLEHPAGPRT